MTMFQVQKLTMFEGADDSFGESDWIRDPLAMSLVGGSRVLTQSSEVPEVGAEEETAGEDRTEEQSEELVPNTGAWALETFNAAYEQDNKAGVAEWINRHAPEV